MFDFFVLCCRSSCFVAIAQTNFAAVRFFCHVVKTNELRNASRAVLLAATGAGVVKTDDYLSSCV